MTPGPDRTGLTPEVEVDRLGEFGAELRRQFDRPLAQIDSESGWEDAILTIEMQDAQSVNCVVIEEDIAHGQRVVSYRIETRGDGE